MAADFDYVCLTPRPLEIGCCLRGQEGAGLQLLRLEVGAVPASDIMPAGSLVLKVVDREGEVLAVLIFGREEGERFAKNAGAAASYLKDCAAVSLDVGDTLAVVGGHHV